MNKNHLGLALLLTFLIVMPWNWLFYDAHVFISIMDRISKFTIYFLLILLILQLMSYIKHKIKYEKELLEYIKKEKNNKKEQE
ncbi:hypothetical protein [Bacillus sp. FSL E2-8887]|uniref:hypothetical protein n=1 Tax=Bacillus sp. FSL E2-8887 TaxID=2954599 RepID=UPI0030F6EF47